MDTDLQEALRAFDQSADPETAARALTCGLRSTQPALGPLRWALSLSRWDSLSEDLHELAARSVAQLLEPDGFTYQGIQRYALGETAHRIPVFARDERSFSLVPAGEVELGYELARYEPGEFELRDVRRFADGMMGEEKIGPERCLEIVRDLFGPGFGAVRTATLEPLLVQQVAIDWPDFEFFGLDLDDDDADEEQALATYRDGALRLPSGDEWELCCSGGARTLFRWGDEIPPGEDPYAAQSGPHRDVNAFGLTLPADTYKTEVCLPYNVRGGDGGSFVCGGWTVYLPWLTLATAWDPTQSHMDEPGVGFGEFEPRVRLVRSVL